MFEFEDEFGSAPCIRVVGVGGGGGNAVDNMVRMGIHGVDFASINTDVQDLRYSLAPTKLQIGSKVTCGLGTGADPELGKKAALEDKDQIEALLQGADMVFITAGMGGGTGTGASPVVAEIARQCGALTVAVVTTPFLVEGRPRMKRAEAGIRELSDKVDTLITIPNEKLLTLVQKDTPLNEAFGRVDDILRQGVESISNLITVRGLINVDFADVRAVMSEPGGAIMGIGVCRGQDRAAEAARIAISNSLLDDVDISGAKGVLINVTGGSSLALNDIHQAVAAIYDVAHKDANIIFGAVVDDNVEQEIKVTILATGLERKKGLTKMRVGEQIENVTSRNSYDQEDIQAPAFPLGDPEPVGASSRGGIKRNKGSAFDIPPFLRRQD